MVLHLRAWTLNEMGDRGLNVCNSVEAIKLATRRRVDAVVLDLDRNHAEVTRVATAIKRSSTAGAHAPADRRDSASANAHELADALVRKRDDLGMLITALENVLAMGSGEPPKVAS